MRSHPLKPAIPPLELPRLVMRRALWVALAAWLIVLALGLYRASHDMEQEATAAQTMAQLSRVLSQAARDPDDVHVLAQMVQLLQAAPLRHLSLRVRDQRGVALLEPAPDAAPPAPLSWWLRWHRAWWPAPERAPVSWAVPRVGGRTWSVELTASHESERLEAIQNLAELLLLAAAGSVALLLAMQWNVRRAFTPMHALLQAIGRMRNGDAAAVQRLPAMPIAELNSIGAALGDLGRALEAAEQQRRALSRQVLTLQEDERQRIARELHDEFGQHLTALRADTAWLVRHVSGDAQAMQVVQAMDVLCARLQREIRGLLDRLQPAALDAASPATLLKLQCLLEELVQAWNATPAAGVRFTLELRAVDAHGTPAPWPDAALADALALPPALVLALYRISQEALTNVARHAHASHASLQLTLSQAADAPVLQWQVSDDGAGLGSLQVALQRGNGLAGIRQRVWAFGGDLACESAPRGLRLSARFALAPATSALAAA